jgi:signal transduction histidine kinase
VHGIRSRFAVTLVVLVALTVAAIGVGTHAFVELRLRDTLLTEAARQAQFALAVLLPGRLPADADLEAFEATGLAEALRLRGDAEFVVDFSDDRPYFSAPSLLGVLDALPGDLRATVDDGRLGYAWHRVAGSNALVVGGRQGSGPALYLVVDARPVDDTLAQLRLGLAIAGLVAILVALAAAGFVARTILRPIASASAAAARIAGGDLGARLRVDGRDEFADWAGEFNRMAGSLESMVARLEAAQQQNRRFVADVSHELRTPLTALVAEASVIEAGLDELPPDARRAAELLVGDVRRLRVLADDLMELSRFDARAEDLRLEPVDLGRLVAATVAARLPEARLALPGDPIVVESDIRRLDRILGNLLDNARVHAPGAPVDVSLERDGDAARIVVADRGPGVDPDALPRLFDRFFKADRSRSTAGDSSSGLGLAIAREHAALLGATLRAEARPGGGLSFVLELPATGSLHRGDAADSEEAEAVLQTDSASRTHP